jgi:K+-sensing histidine kinase KdpD
MMTLQQENRRSAFSLQRIEQYASAVLVVAALTGVLYLIGRSELGEGVIALIYLVPIVWSAARWGQGPGLAAAVTAALAFDFFFIPPFFTLTVGSLEGWLILIIFTLVAIVIVGRIQAGLSQAQKKEREAIFMYELSVALASARTPEAVASSLAEKLQQLYLAELVQVSIDAKSHQLSFITSAPSEKTAETRPDRVLPIVAPQGLMGEIWLWSGSIPLPTVDDPLLKGFAAQGAHTLQRILVNHGTSNEPANAQ